MFTNRKNVQQSQQSQFDELIVEVSERGVLHIKPSNLVKYSPAKDQMNILDSMIDDGLIVFEK